MDKETYGKARIARLEELRKKAVRGKSQKRNRKIDWYLEKNPIKKERLESDAPILQHAEPVDELLPLPTTPSHELAVRIKRKVPLKNITKRTPSLHTRSKDVHASTSLVAEGETISMSELVTFIITHCRKIMPTFEVLVVTRVLRGDTLEEIATDTNHSYTYVQNCAVWGFQKIEISILNPAGYRSVGSYKDRNFAARVQKGKSIRSIKIGGGRYVLDEDAKKFIKP